LDRVLTTAATTTTASDTSGSSGGGSGGGGDSMSTGHEHELFEVEQAVVCIQHPLPLQ
jgi:hypothetical protein